MRYYDLHIWFPHKSTGVNDAFKGIWKKGEDWRIVHPQKPSLRFSSFVNQKTEGAGFEAGGTPGTGIYDPGALDIHFEIDEVDVTTASKSVITIRGIDIKTIGQASNLQGAQIRLLAGTSTPPHHIYNGQKRKWGLILEGTVFSSFGTWEETEMSLQLYVTPYTTGKSFQFLTHARKGLELKYLIYREIARNFPNCTIEMNVKKNPLLPEAMQGSYSKFDEFVHFVKDTWKQLTNEFILITSRGRIIYVADQSASQEPLEIKFTELIGQPSWNGSKEISFICPVRSDIKVTDIVTLPSFSSSHNNSPGTNAWGSIKLPKDPVPLPKDRSLFSGQFMITDLHHLGQFRSEKGLQWVTSYKAVPTASHPDKDSKQAKK
ncbi:hypothetical protein [Aristophania vespae]|uniref:hypothetical protein n=1 Tax=Aristophania vespae TaxID=2697033 RepID=UPI0023518617|nr:hypothetical protein [Aristophania vespae]UMM63145.1 hypothetical protein DM15PD_01000 [Aristophania vespae]